MDKVEALRHVGFMQGLPEDDLRYVAVFFHEERFRAGDYIFREGDFGDSMSVIQDGQVEITKRIEGESSTEAGLQIFAPYEYFGEMSVLDDSPRSATAKAHTEVTLLTVTKDDMLHLFIVYPQLLQALFRTFSNRLRNTNEQFAKTLGQLLQKSKMEAIGSAASKIIHDLKTPLTIILLTSELLEARFSGTDKLVRKIVNQANTIDDMVREILDYARGDQASLDIHPNDLEAIFAEIGENLSLLATDHDIHISYRNDVQEKVFFDTKRIRRTITNIVKNAIEAIKEHGAIFMEAVRDGEVLRIRISDDGPGIPESILDTIFEPFVTQGKVNGTGLGLAICQKVIADHGGSIRAYNGQKGARFEIALPYRIQ